jgi:hypothetical protein
MSDVCAIFDFDRDHDDVRGCAVIDRATGSLPDDTDWRLT